VNVFSGSSLIGRISLTLDELLALPVNDKGLVELISNLIDGASFSGRIRILMLIKPLLEDPATMMTTTNGDEELEHEDDFFYRAEKALGGLGMATALASNTGGKEGRGFVDEEGGVRIESKSEKERDTTAYIHTHTKTKLRGSPTSSTPKSYLFAGGLVDECPFIIRVFEIGVYDTKKISPLFPNSLYMNAVCGVWGGCTHTCHNSGESACWIDLHKRWVFTVKEGSVLRINVWSALRRRGGAAVAITTATASNNNNTSIFN
jgi:hypothetical protein